MSILTKNATLNSTPFAWLLSGAASAVDALDAQAEGKFIEDDNSSATESNILFGFDFSAIPAGSIINDVVITYHTGRSAVGAGNLRYRVKDALGNVTNGAHLSAGASWTVRSFSVARPAGGAWVDTDLTTANNIRVTFQGDGLGGAGIMIRVDYLEITVEYTEPSGCVIIDGDF
jgi:hypothetical protein